MEQRPAVAGDARLREALELGVGRAGGVGQRVGDARRGRSRGRSRAGGAVLTGRNSGPKERGSSASSVVVWRAPLRAHRWISAPGTMNSRSRWRQPPQGTQKSSPSAITATSVICVQPRRRPARRSRTPPRTGPAGRRRSRRSRRRGSSRPRRAAPRRPCSWLYGAWARAITAAGGVHEGARADHLVGVGVAQDALGRDLQRLGEPGDALELVSARSESARGDALELDEVAEVLHAVEVDADALPQQQVAFLLDHGQHAEAGLQRRLQRLPGRRSGSAGSGYSRASSASTRSYWISVGAAGLLLAQLQPARGRRGSTCRAGVSTPRSRAPEAEDDGQRALGIRVGRLELDVAARRGHGPTLVRSGYGWGHGRRSRAAAAASLDPARQGHAAPRVPRDA